MKLQLIENICKQVVSLVLLAGICLLYSKGIIPVYLLVLFLLSGILIRIHTIRGF
jgi:mannose/fructose/N-acetylgalactosamine-specific phosphotransferase system component IID